MDHVLLTLILYIRFELSFGQFAMEAISNKIPEQFFEKKNGKEFEQHFQLALLFLV